MISVYEADSTHSRWNCRSLPGHEQNSREVNYNCLHPQHRLSTAAVSLNLAQLRTELSVHHIYRAKLLHFIYPAQVRTG